MTEENVADAAKEVRLALLEADVNYGVVKELIKRIKEKAMGGEVAKTISPGQQFMKVVHDELAALMGGEEGKLILEGYPAVVMLCGLQGSGKTTQSAKLAHYIKKKQLRKKILLVACDLQRPAAIEQLKTLGQQAQIPVFTLEGEKDPVKVAKAALAEAKKESYDLLIVDTAGRLHIDEEMMVQLENLKELLRPQEILFVANATTGQDAVNIAAEFNKRIAVTGTILTMLDGNARAGAAISIREITGKPLKFEGIGEKLEDFQLFNPQSMADRILGMGDTINLVKKAEEHFSEEEGKKLEEKILSATFTYQDYLEHMKTMKKMGPIKSLLSMLPGMGNSPMMNMDDKQFHRMEVIIQSMTKEEQQEKCELSVPRKKRIAKGSGTTEYDVDRLVKSFKQIKQLCKNMPSMKQMQQMLGGSLWR